MKKGKILNIEKVLRNDPLDDNSVTLSLYYDMRSEKKDEKFPVKLRVSQMRKHTYKHCTDLDLDSWVKLIEGKNDHNTKYLRGKLYKSYDELKDKINALIKEGDFSLDALKHSSSKGRKDYILEYFTEHIEELRRKGKIGTASWYSCAKENIDNYLHPWKKDIKLKKGTEKHLRFSDITEKWLEDYEAYLLKKESSQTTISMYMRALRAIVNKGRGKAITEAQYPFYLKKKNRGYEIPEPTGRKIALNESQKLKVFNYEIRPQDEKWRDLWVFSFYAGGANMNDICRYKYKDIIRSGDEEFIIWQRAKTRSTKRESEMIKTYITPEMKEIIIKWGDPEKKPSNYIFSFLTPNMTPEREREIVQLATHQVNKKMKKIGDVLGIPNLTTYVARHSWASISRTNKVSLYAIKKQLGHSSLKTTEIYLESIPNEELIENAMLMPRRNGN